MRVMDTVLQFDRSRRTPSSSSKGYIVCECGSAYFKLVITSPEGDEQPGLVTLAPDGRVAGRMGTPVCNQCGRTANHP